MENSMLDESQNIMNSTVNSHGLSFDKAFDMSDTFDKIINDDYNDYNKSTDDSSINIKDSFDNKYDNLVNEYENLNCIMHRLEKKRKGRQCSKTINTDINMREACDNKFDNLMEEYEKLNCDMARLESVWKERQHSRCKKEHFTDNLITTNTEEIDNKRESKDIIEPINKVDMVKLTDKIIQNYNNNLSIIMEEDEEDIKSSEDKWYEADIKCEVCEKSVVCTETFIRHNKNIHMTSNENHINTMSQD